MSRMWGVSWNPFSSVRKISNFIGIIPVAAHSLSIHSTHTKFEKWYQNHHKSPKPNPSCLVLAVHSPPIPKIYIYIIRIITLLLLFKIHITKLIRIALVNVTLALHREGNSLLCHRACGLLGRNCMSIKKQTCILKETAEKDNIVHSLKRLSIWWLCLPGSVQSGLDTTKTKRRKNRSGLDYKDKKKEKKGNRETCKARSGIVVAVVTDSISI